MELATLMTLIAILIALLLPAVQYSRESGRRAHCKNNLKQLALGFHLHEEAHGHFPTGGWGWRWHGDPDRGYGSEQPGGWVYNILPFVERPALRERGAGADEALKRQEGRTVAQTAIQVFSCPGRRPSVPYPFKHATDFVNIDRPGETGRSDYSANCGDDLPELFGPGPGSLAEAARPTYRWIHTNRTGVVFRRSTTRHVEVLDGLSTTYLLAEGYLDVSRYQSGDGLNDDQSMYVGYDQDTLRLTSMPPRRDSSRIAGDSNFSFGSAHDQAFQAAMSDGSVHSVRYSITFRVHRLLGNRADGYPLSLHDFARVN